MGVDRKVSVLSHQLIKKQSQYSIRLDLALPLELSKVVVIFSLEPLLAESKSAIQPRSTGHFYGANGFLPLILINISSRSSIEARDTFAISCSCTPFFKNSFAKLFTQCRYCSPSSG